MDVKVLSNSDGQLKFIANGMDPSFMNAIRRIIMAEVAIPAIEKVYIAENTSVLYDDIIAHRLGLIPLQGGEILTLTEKCDCDKKGCPKCESILTLEVEAAEDNFVVYSGRMKAEGSVFPANNNIPIVEMNAGQKLTLETHARLGLGKNHAKWQPVSACAVKYEPIIEIDSKKCDLCGACIEECPKKILKEKGSTIVVTSLWECTLCRLCEEACPPAAIKISYDDRNSMLIVETTGSLTNDELVLAACDVMLQKCEELKSSIKGLPEAS